MFQNKKNLAAPKNRDDFTESIEFKELIHDLRNSLSIILMQAQLISQYAETAGSEKETIKKSSETIERGVKDMVALLTNE